jgi:ribonuclease J
LNVIAHARQLGYVKCPEDLFVPLKAARNLPDDQVLILTTGSQGEPLAAMTRISKGEHPQIKVRAGDTIIFSANPIPGNTIAVVSTIDRLMMQGADVIYGREKGIHVSGHGSQEEHKLMLALTKPKFFVPVHGEHRMLVKHAQMAQAMGIPAENTVIVNNGDMIELSTDRIGISGQVKAGIELVDQAGIVHEHVMLERQHLAEDGLVTVAAAVSRDGKLLAQPEVHLRGVVMTVERALFHQLIIRTIERFLVERWSDFCISNGTEKVNWDYLQKELENTLQRLVKRELQSSPMLVFILQTETPLFSTNGFTHGKGTENGDRLVNKIKPMLASALSTVTTITLEEKEVSKPEIASTKTYRRKRSTASVS